MKTHTTAPNDKGFRFPPEIIRHAVWRYFRFPLEELVAQRGIVVTDETVRQWRLKFGQMSANKLRRHRPGCGDKWHLDEVFLKINGRIHSLWRAVAQDGNVLALLVQSLRNKHAAKRFFRKSLKELQYVPRVIIPDQLKSYGSNATRDPAKRRASSAQRAEQPSATLTPTNETARIHLAAFQISWACTTVPFRFWSDLGSFSSQTPSSRGQRLPSLMQDRFLVGSQVTGGKVATSHLFLPSNPQLFPPLPPKALQFIH